MMATLLTGSLIGGVNAKDLSLADTKVENAKSAHKFNQGDWLLGFSGSYNHITAADSDGSESVDVAFLSLDAAYFVSDNVSFGLGTFGLLVPSKGSSVEDTGYLFGLEPNVKYYFQKYEKFTPYVGAHFGYAYGKVDDESENVTSLGLDAGVLVPLNDKVLLDLKLKWSDYDLEEPEIDTIQFQVGLKFRF